MSTSNFENNGVNGTGTSCEGLSPGRISSVRQRGPGRNPTTVRTKWNKSINKVVMECFYRSKPYDENGKPLRGYRQRMFREWEERGMFESTEQRISDQARLIRKNGYLSEVELETIKRAIKEEAELNVHNMEGEISVVVDNVDSVEGVGENDATRIAEKPIIGILMDNGELEKLNEEQREIAEGLRTIIVEGKTTDGIFFKNIDRNRLRSEINKVNQIIQHINTRNITETNALIRAASVWVAE